MIERLCGLGLMPFLSLIYRRKKGIILTYHQVLPNDPLTPRRSIQASADEFEAQMRFLSATCAVMGMEAFLAGLQGNRLPALACVVTFDDGFVDNYEIALPILRRYNIPATFFVSSAYVALGRPYEANAWWDLLMRAPSQDRVELDLRPWGGPSLTVPYATPPEQASGRARILRAFKQEIRYVHRVAIAEYLAERFRIPIQSLGYPRMMTPDQVRELAGAGMTIASHTEWHISLAAEGPDEYARQLRDSRQTLRDMCGQPVDYFSYPFGDPEYCVPAWQLVRDAGYTAAFMACGRPADLRHGPWLIDRLGTSYGVAGLCASMLGVKPSQFRNRRKLAGCLADAPVTS